MSGVGGKTGWLKIKSTIHMSGVGGKTGWLKIRILCTCTELEENGQAQNESNIHMYHCNDIYTHRLLLQYTRNINSAFWFSAKHHFTSGQKVTFSYQGIAEKWLT